MICEIQDNHTHETFDFDSCEPSIVNLRIIVQKHSAKLFKWGQKEILVDVQTANVMVQVYDHLKPENKEKVAKMIKDNHVSFLRVIEIAWKAVS